VVGVDLTSAGEIDPDGKFEAAVFEDEGVYRKIVVEDGRIKGFIFLGQTSGVKECQAALEQEKDIGSLIKEMGEKDFDFSKMT
jgi:nitrite reductase (NADH) large subunit